MDRILDKTVAFPADVVCCWSIAYMMHPSTNKFGCVQVPANVTQLEAQVFGAWCICSK